MVFSDRIHTFFSNIKITISNHFRLFSIIFVSKIGLGKKVWYLVIGYNCESFSIVFVSKIGLGKKVCYLVLGYTPFFLTSKLQFQSILNHFQSFLFQKRA